jgi:hypothetical protein
MSAKPRTSQRATLEAENARLRAALTNIKALAELAPSADLVIAWSALGGIKYWATSALAPQS